MSRWSLPASAALLGGLTLAALLAPWLAPVSPEVQLDPSITALRPPRTRLWAVHTDGPRPWRLADRVEWRGDQLVLERRSQEVAIPRAQVLNATPEGVADRQSFPLGTDQLGRDVLSRLLYGSRISLTVALLATLLALGVGVSVGSLAALSGPTLDAALMRCVDALLCFPTLLLLLVLAAFAPPTVALLVSFLGLTGWMGLSRLVRGEMLRLRGLDWALAARASGVSPRRLWLRHLLPHAASPVLVDTSLRVGTLVLLEAALSYLGFGVPAPTPSWGAMIAEGQPYIASAWWLAVFPGLLLTLTAMAFFLLADGLRDRLDPRARAILPVPARKGSLESDQGVAT